LTLESISGVLQGRLNGSFVVSHVALAPDRNQVLIEGLNRERPRTLGIHVGRFDTQAIRLLIPLEAVPGTFADNTFTSLGWSPDSKRIVFDLRGTITTADVQTGATVNLASGTRPTWSPNGDWIAYVTSKDEARLIRPDGTGDHGILHGRKVLGTLHWSPDSDYVMFEERYLPNMFEWWIRPAGSSARLVVCRVRDETTIPVYWSGGHGGSDAYFGWIYDYQHFGLSDTQ